MAFTVLYLAAIVLVPLLTLPIESFSDVDAEVLAVDVDQPLETAGEQRDLGRRRPLLRCEDAGGVDEARPHVTGRDQLDAP